MAAAASDHPGSGGKGIVRYRRPVRGCDSKRPCGLPDCFYPRAKDKRAKRIVEVYGETEVAIDKRIRDKDKRRAVYYEFYTGQTWGLAENFHLALDSGELGIDTCVAILADLYQR